MTITDILIPWLSIKRLKRENGRLKDAVNKFHDDTMAAKKAWQEAVDVACRAVRERDEARGRTFELEHRISALKERMIALKINGGI